MDLANIENILLLRFPISHRFLLPIKQLKKIYYSGFSSCLEYQTVTKKYYNFKYISDHYPIIARLIF